MKKILVAIHTATFGGPHNQILKMNDGFKELDYEIIVLLPLEEGTAYKILTQAGITCIKTRLTRLRLSDGLKNILFPFKILQESKEIARIIRNYEISIVQVCGLMHPQAAMAAKLVNIPVVWQLLSDFAPMSVRYIFMPFLVIFSDVTMTTGERILYKHPFNRFLRKNIIFYPPVETKTFENDRRFCNPPLNVITIGNLNRQKGHELLIEIANITDDDLASFTIYGSMDTTNQEYYQKNVIDLAEKYGLLGKKIEFSQIKPSEVPKIMKDADIFILTSIAEGVPTVVIEAMAAGLPVISSNVGSISEVVIDGSTGILVNERNKENFLKAIKEMGEISKRRDMSEKGVARAKEYFDISECLAAHDKAFDMCLRRINEN